MDEGVGSGHTQRGEEKPVTEGGQQIKKPKTKLVENVSESVFPVGSSGKVCVCLCVQFNL